MSELDLNPQFRKVLELLENTHRHVFITGKAGTGKSTLLAYFRTHTVKKCVVLAPTGVAAVNVAGETIHSFFHFMPNVTLDDVQKIARRMKKNKLYREVEMIIIDEVSMVRADLLDCVDQFLQVVRQNNIPFGGVQMVFIGDLYQLPPVVKGDEQVIFKAVYHSPYFFSARVVDQLLNHPKGIQLELIELEKIYRQKDTSFIQLLNAIRNRSITDEDMTKLNERHELRSDFSDTYVYLTSFNKQADAINQSNLGRLPSAGRVYHAHIEGHFEQKNCPASEQLLLKVGARVMFLNNDNTDRWINGTMGTVTKTRKEDVLVKLDTREEMIVKPFIWKLYKTFYNETTRQLDKEIVGSFRQIPLQLAWAITIHKSQGKTFNKVIIDIGRGAFAHGQVYVALSRCRTFDGIILKQPLKKSHILMDWHVVKFLTSFQYRRSEERIPLTKKIDLLEQAIQEKCHMKITYLKAKDEKSQRTILPLRVEEMEYKGFRYLGLEAYCFLRKDNRIFRVEKILELTPAVITRKGTNR